MWTRGILLYPALCAAPQVTYRMTPLFSFLRAPPIFLLGQASFQRANVLMSMERYGEALVELEVVRDNVPKESAVYFLMGKVSQSLASWNLAAVSEAADSERSFGTYLCRWGDLCEEWVRRNPCFATAGPFHPLSISRSILIFFRLFCTAKLPLPGVQEARADGCGDAALHHRSRLAQQGKGCDVDPALNM